MRNKDVYEQTCEYQVISRLDQDEVIVAVVDDLRTGMCHVR